MTSDAMVMDVSQDWAMACDVQQRFMQSVGRAAEGLDFSGCCRQMLALGGDCYDFRPTTDDRLALTVGDASGKSVAAALMISNVQSSLRTAVALYQNDLAAALSLVNDQVYESSLPGQYATVFCGIFEGAACTLRYVNAGHNPPMLIRRDGSVGWLESGGAPVGMFRDLSYEEGSVQLNKGDLFIAYTDGVTEAVNAADEEWGVDRLRNAATQSTSECAAEIAEAIFKSMDDYSRGRQSDDATVVVARVL